MVTLVTVEAPDSHSAVILGAKLKRWFYRHEHDPKRREKTVVLDFRDDACPYVRARRFLEAASKIPDDAEIAFCPVPFYSFRGDARTWFEFSNLVSEKLSLETKVDVHVMLFLVLDEHELLDESIGKQASETRHWPLSIESAEDWNEDSVRTAKNPVGHPFKALSFVVPVPRFAADTPALIDDICEKMIKSVYSCSKRVRESPASLSRLSKA